MEERRSSRVKLVIVPPVIGVTAIGPLISRFLVEPFLTLGDLTFGGVVLSGLFASFDLLDLSFRGDPGRVAEMKLSTRLRGGEGSLVGSCRGGGGGGTSIAFLEELPARKNMRSIDG
jgi:hypothetical protein